jgi:hypothetical protein
MKNAIVLVLPLVAACSSSYMREAQTSGPPGEGESKVIFCRPSRFTGSAVTFDVWDSLKLIGFAENGSYFEYRCSPGKHLFLAEAESDKAIDADLASRKTYYVWVTPRMGVFSANLGLTPVNKDSELMPKVEKALEKNKCRELIPDIGAEYQDRYRERMQKLKETFEGERKEKTLKLLPEDGQ